MNGPALWITGAGGLIGHHLIQTAPDLPLRPLTRPELDLTDFHAVERLYRLETPPAIIHCAAISKTPECQAHPQIARLVNVEATRHLAELARDIPFLFLSTDLVFDGSKGAYREDDAVNPLSVYAETKVAAESTVLSNPKHSVIRTSLNYGFSPSGRRSFNEELVALWEKNETAKLFVDEFRCPIPAEVTSRAIWSLLEKRRPGLYHLAGAEKMSRFDIGQCIARRYPQFSHLIQPVGLGSYRGSKRPPDTSLCSAKIQSILAFPLPRFSAWLDEHLTNPAA